MGEQRAGMSCGAQTSDALGRQAVRSMLNHFLLSLPSIPRAMLSIWRGWEGKGGPPASQ